MSSCRAVLRAWCVAWVGVILVASPVAGENQLSDPDSFLDDEFHGHWDVSGGLVDSEFSTGLNFTAGYVIDRGPLLVNLNFVDWNVYSEEAEGFRREPLGGGEICRDLSTGQFAYSYKCEDGEIDFAASVEAGYVFRKPRHPFVIGFGARVLGDEDLGGDDLAYGTLQLFSKRKRLYGKLRLSSDYNQVSMGVAF